MRAYVLYGVDDLRYEEVSYPELAEGEVMVKVAAAGICGSDIPRIYETGAHRHPIIPGHEFSGVVVEAKDGFGEHWVGKGVGVFPLIPCYKCSNCVQKRYEMCKNYSYLGSRCDGGFAEYVAVPQQNLIEIPDNVSFEQAAMLEPMSVAVHAIRRVNIKKPQYVTVCGLGTIGLLLVMFLQEQGVDNILVIGNKDFQKECAMQLGIPKQNYCDSRSQNIEKWCMELTGGNGTDIFFECVGKNETVSLAMNITSTGGKIMLVGNPASDMAFDKTTYWKILRNQLEISGTWNSSFTASESDDWHYVMKCLEEGRIQPEKLISHRFGMDDLEKGLRMMKDKSDDYVKVMGHL